MFSNILANIGIEKDKKKEEYTVKGEDIVEDEVFDVEKRASRGSVIGISEPSFPKRRIEFRSCANDLRPEPRQPYLLGLGPWHGLLLLHLLQCTSE